MKVKQLREVIKDLPDDLEIFIKPVVNICGNIAELDEVIKTSYGFMGIDIPCLILDSLGYPANRKQDENAVVLYTEKEEDNAK